MSFRKTLSFNTFQRRTRKVAVIGVGNVGVAGAYAMYLRNTCQELLLIDIDKKRAEGEALDLQHGQGLTGRMAVRAAEYKDLVDTQVVVLTAGVAQRPGETRLNLLDRNAKIFQRIVSELDAHAPNAIILVTSNPVDLLTYLVQEMSNRPTNRVIGTGTLLDSSRFRTLVGQYYACDPRSVHGYVLGEHGDSEVVAFSTVSIGGLSVHSGSVLGVPFDKEAMDSLAKDVVNAAYKIIEGKGYTNLAIGVCIASLVEAILNDSAIVLPVSVRLSGQYGLHDVCLSMPCRIGLGGVDIPEEELALFEDERVKFIQSGNLMKALLSECVEKLKEEGVTLCSRPTATQ